LRKWCQYIKLILYHYIGDDIMPKALDLTEQRFG